MAIGPKSLPLSALVSRSISKKGSCRPQGLVRRLNQVHRSKVLRDPVAVLVIAVNACSKATGQDRVGGSRLSQLYYWSPSIKAFVRDANEQEDDYELLLHHASPKLPSEGSTNEQ